MKNRIRILLALLMCLMLTAKAESENVWNFEDGSVGGFIQSGSCRLSVCDMGDKDGSLALGITDRADHDWDAADLSASRAGIRPGDTVHISFLAYQESGKDGTVSVAYAGGSYGILLSAPLPSGKWVRVEGSFDYSEEQALRFKVDDALSGADYFIDDLCIKTDGEPAADTGFSGYQSDFSAGTDGWYARSGGTAQVEIADEALKITGRAATWNSPGRNFDLQAGESYRLGVYVMQDEADSAEFMISAAHSRDGSESYENIARATAKKGEWTYVGGVYSPGRYDNYILYVETTGNGTLSFSIRDFYVTAQELTFPMNIERIRDAYEPLFPVGTAITQSEALSKPRMDFVASQFAVITPGNELKPDSVLNIGACRRAAKTDETAVVISLDAAKPLLSYCMKNGIPVHGHTLLWHNQTPDSFFRLGYSTSQGYASREIMLGRMENYIRAVMEETERLYPGLIVSWDVVNEAIDDNTGALRDCMWKKTVGDDYILQAFAFARKYAPEGTLLCYNDYSVPYPTKLNGITALLEQLAAEGTIDCCGMQAHYQLNTPTVQQVETAIERIASLGLTVRISEMDIVIGGNNDLYLSRQAERYKSLMQVYIRHADVIESVQFWGVTDDLSWLSGRYPLLFDRDAQPKPAFKAVIAAAREALTEE